MVCVLGGLCVGYVVCVGSVLCGVCCEWCVGRVAISSHHAVTPPNLCHAKPPDTTPPHISPPHPPTQPTQPAHPPICRLLYWMCGAGLGWLRGGPPATPFQARSCQAGPPRQRNTPCPTPICPNPTAANQQYANNIKTPTNNSTTQQQHNNTNNTTLQHTATTHGATPHNAQQQNTRTHRSASHRIATRLLPSLPP